jgi:UDP-GlcNAc:undecaprenyl-phosphate/decaprenyl-phosphate GlcNAc-1-phosphate transferase
MQFEFPVLSEWLPFFRTDRPLAAALLCSLSAFIITAVIIPEIIKIADSYNIMVDRPNERKLHRHKVPTLGGLAMLIGFVIATLIWAWAMQTGVRYLIVALGIIGGIGVRDDFLPLSAPPKLVAQTAAAFVMMYFGDVRFVSLHGFLGVYQIPDLLSYSITLFTFIVITNAFNLIDGLNGLAGSVALIVFTFYGSWFYRHDSTLMLIVCFSLLGSTAGFLLFNYRARIFMGDTGSLLLGFLASTCTITFINENASRPANDMLAFSNPVAMASCILVYPLFDTLRVFIFRLAEGRSPFSADRNHLHHWLLRLGLSHLQSSALICVVSLAFLGMGFMSNKYLGDNVLVPIVVALAYLLSLWLQKAVLKKEGNKN